MPSRLARGRSTKANARLEALLRVIDWLTCTLTGADWTARAAWAAAGLPSRPVSDFASGGHDGDGDGDGGGGRGDDAPPHLHRMSPAAEETPLFVRGGRLWTGGHKSSRTTKGRVPTPARSG